MKQQIDVIIYANNMSQSSLAFEHKVILSGHKFDSEEC